MQSRSSATWRNEPFTFVDRSPTHNPIMIRVRYLPFAEGFKMPRLNLE